MIKNQQIYNIIVGLQNGIDFFKLNPFHVVITQKLSAYILNDCIHC